jgi:hypothetical protein
MTEVESDDAVQYEDLAELFGFRWNTELDIRSIKTHLNLNHLRCKSPAMVRKEFWGTMLAYTAIRATLLGTAWICGTRPREVSFVSCCQFVLAAWDVIDTIPAEASRAYCVSRLGQIGKCLVGKRLGRIEPRVRRKRGSNYNLMMQPRQVLQAKLASGDNSFETK